jgi:hypothetical protein
VTRIIRAVALEVRVHRGELIAFALGAATIPVVRWCTGTLPS